MKKRVLALLLSIALVFSLCVAVSAISEQDVFTDDTIGAISSEDGESAILYGDEDFYLDDFDDSLYEEDYTASIEDLEYMLSQFGEENVGILIATVVVIMICSLLFLPALILLIVFAVLNSKLKKKIIEFETRISVMQQQAVPQGVPYTVAPQATTPYTATQAEPQGTEPTPVEAPAETPVEAPVEAPADDNNEGGEA